ncbi:hypothetical protein [Marinobacter fuscus]|uniref:hypothetical protein n=1 Tax=Marinobacter fuscus TaxID=2109942 RepID=UPI001980CB2A|nr:hypothetical protein [Marinobacter fuscus]
MLFNQSGAWCAKAGTAIAFSLLLGLTGCGGGGGGGGGDTGGDTGGGGGGSVGFNEGAATISSNEDAKLGAEAATQSARQAIAEEATPDSPFGVAIQVKPQEWLVNHSLELVDSALAPTGAVMNVAGDCGGNARVNYTNNQFDNYSVVYDNYCTGSGEYRSVINGTFDFFGYDNVESGGEWGYTFDYTVTYRGETTSTKGTYRCNGDFLNCTYTSDYVGTNGRTYRTSNVDVDDNFDGSYDVSARVYDGDRGYIDYQATDLLLCEGGYGFQSGSIVVTDSSGGNVLRVDFADCNSFTVTYNGVSETYNY